MSSRGRARTWWQRVFPEITRHYVNLDDVARYSPAADRWYARGIRGAIARDEALRRRSIVAKYNTIQRVIDGATLAGESISWRQARDRFDAAGGLMTDDEKSLRQREYMERGYDAPTAWGLMQDEVEDAIRRLVSP